jgi:TonB family protein
MSAKQARRLLIVAFALSLLIHLIVTLFVRWPYRPSPEQYQVVRLVRLHPTRIAHISTPPPQTPKPVPTIAATTAPSRPVHSRPGERGFRSGPPHVVRTAAPPVPSASAAPTPNCFKADTPAQVVASPPPPDIAPNARGQATSGTARVRVTIDPQGNVQNATVAASSGNSSLDLVAVTMARDAQYAPATHACKAVASDYIFSVRFVAW